MQPRARVLNVLIKTHKPDMPIRPVINNTHAPAHKLAKYINRKIMDWQILPYTYNTKNSLKTAEELIKLNTKPNHRIITLDTNDLYTNLPTKGIIEAIKHWLGQSTVSKGEKEQIIPILETIVQQNYFQYNNLYYRPTKGVAMGSPLSGTLAELYLQYLEKIYIKHWINSREIYFYTRYVDDILLIYDVNLVTEEKISQHLNEIGSNLKFKLTTEINKCISF